MKKFILLSLVLMLAFGMVGTALAGGTVTPRIGRYSETGAGPCDDWGPKDICTSNSGIIGGATIPGAHLWQVRKLFVPVPLQGYQFVGRPAHVVAGSALTVLFCFEGSGIIYQRNGSSWDIVASFPYLGRTCAYVGGGDYALFAAK